MEPFPRTPDTIPARYSWIGGKRRSSDGLADLVLMGVRLYNPATGRFLSVDPIPGGNANPYIYPENPIDGYDPLLRIRPHRRHDHQGGNDLSRRTTGNYAHEKSEHRGGME